MTRASPPPDRVRCAVRVGVAVCAGNCLNEFGAAPLACNADSPFYRTELSALASGFVGVVE